MKVRVELLRSMPFGGYDYDRPYILDLTKEEYDWLLSRDVYTIEDDPDTVYLYPEDAKCIEFVKNAKVWEEPPEPWETEPLPEFNKAMYQMLFAIEKSDRLLLENAILLARMS